MNSSEYIVKTSQHSSTESEIHEQESSQSQCIGLSQIFSRVAPSVGEKVTQLSQVGERPSYIMNV